MKKVVTGQQMKELDTFTIEKMGVPSLVLMERAALAVAEEVLRGGYSTKRILVVCGSGNNGGDGVAAARILHLKGYHVDIWEVGNPEKYSEGMKAQTAIAGNYRINFVTNPVYHEYTVIVDAVFGVGLTREITGRYAEIIEQINQSRVPVVAVDIPSGINSDTGKQMGCAVHAAATVTFAYGKAGNFLGDGQTHCGKVIIADIGIYAPDRIADEKMLLPCANGKDVSLYQIEECDLQRLPKRQENGNKGTFGKVLLIAGSEHMAGAALLAGKACMRAGCGMLKIYTVRGNRDFLLAGLPEAMLSVYEDGEDETVQLQQDLDWADVIGIGPGLSTNPRAARILEYVLKYKGQKPCVMDADALNLLSVHMELLDESESPCILTPHIGEFARILGEETSAIKGDPVDWAWAFSKKYGVVCVCKDARTVTMMPDGTGYINTSGCSALATAGSGDVLTGILLGLLAQTPGHQEIQIAPLAVYLHGRLGERAARRLSAAGVLAEDLIDELVIMQRELEQVDEKTG